MVQLRPVHRDTARPVGERSGLGHLCCEPAKVSPSFPAGSADPARRHEREHDVIAGFEVLDAGAGLNHDSGRLVAEDEREGLGQVTVDHVQIRRADTACCDPNEDLLLLRWVEIDLEDLDRLTGLPEHCRPRLHSGEPTSQGGIQSRGASRRPQGRQRAPHDREPRPRIARARRGDRPARGERSLPLRLEPGLGCNAESVPGRAWPRGRRRRRGARRGRDDVDSGRPCRPLLASLLRALFLLLAGRPVLCEWSTPAMLAGTMPDGTTRLSSNGDRRHHYSFLSTFAERCVVPEASCVPIRRTLRSPSRRLSAAQS